MKKFLPIFIAVLLTLPALAQMSARERQQAMHPQRQVSAEAPGKNIHFPATTPRNQPFQFTMQHTQREKNTRALMQQMDSYVYQDYDPITSSWINNFMNEFLYDAYGNNTSDIFFTWNPDTELYEIVGKQEFTYANGNLSEQTYYEWDAGENMYVQLSQWTYAYNGDGYMTIAYNYFWNGSFWDLAGRDERTYDAAGNMVQQILAFWDPSTDEWFNHTKTENSYNGSGALLVSTTFSWNFFTQDWLNSYRDEYTYNGTGQQISTIYSIWNEGSNQWVNDYKDEFTYDGNMNMVMILESEWDGTQWLNIYKSELTYNNAYSSDEIILPWMFLGEAGMLAHMITGVTEYEYVSRSFEPVNRSQFNYSEVNLTAIAEHETSQARIYPQPASDRVTFSWDSNQGTLELGIYDLNGKIVLSQQIDKQGSVSVDQLKPGLYFYRLADSHKTQLTGKISVK